MLSSKMHFLATNSHSDINKHCALYHHPAGFSAGKRTVYVMCLQFSASRCCYSHPLLTSEMTSEVHVCCYSDNSAPLCCSCLSLSR